MTVQFKFRVGQLSRMRFINSSNRKDHFVFLCFTLPASLGQLLVLLGSRLLWVPPQPLCASAFLSRLLWDSFSRVLAYLGPFPSFLEMHGLGDFDAPLDSVALISLIECISRALAAAASRLLWELLFC